MAHWSPFHCSTNVRFVPSPLAYRAEPVAKHEFWVGQAMPTRLVWLALAGLGTVCAAQLVPSQRSAIGWLKPVCPTAVQLVGVEHATALRKSSVVPGVGSTIQVVPSHCSAKAPPALVDFAKKLPTAVQLVPPVHDTAASVLPEAPTGIAAI